LLFERVGAISTTMKTIQPWVRRMVVSLCLLGTFSAQAGSQPGAAVAWGWNDYGQADVPPGLSKVVAVAGGDAHSLALQSNGTVVAWGAGKTNDPSDFRNCGQSILPLGLSNVVAIAGGGYHSLALESNGTVVAWGAGKTNNPSHFPDYGQSIVPLGLGNVVAVAGGLYHSLALQGNGKVVAWGYNGYGQTNVPQGLSNVVAIAGGGYHSLALQSNGKAVAWGYNFFGQTNVPPGLSNVMAIAGGIETSLALQSNRTVVAWGDNGEGQTNVPPGLSSMVAIAGGDEHSLALLSNGMVMAWGYNGNGQTNVPPGLSNVVAIAGGGFHSLAITLGPAISPQPPVTILLASGGSTNLSVCVSSGSPFTCRWFLNGSPIAGATGTNFLISNFDVTKAGAYSVAVTNQYGYATAVSVLRLTNSPIILVDGVDVGGGTVNRTNTSQITMSSSFEPNANIYYTLDGSAPSYLGIPYHGAFQLGTTATIRALAYDSAYLSSAEAPPITVQITPLYPLTATTPGGGSLSFSPAPYSGGNLFVSNTLVTITATPSNGWSFLGWLGDASGSSPVVALSMNRGMAVGALFGTTVGPNVLGAGQIQFSPQVPVYPFGATVGLTSIPQPGNYFINWAGALSGSINPNVLVMASASPVVTALFGPLAVGQYALTVLPQGAGSVAVSPYTNRYSSGTVVTLTAVPSAGQSFIGWSGDAIGSQNPLGMTMDRSKVITASFTQHPLLSTAPPLNRMVEQGFRFSLIGGLGASFRIDGSADLMSWTPLGWITNTFGTSQYLDTAAETNASQFYRAVAQ
jgi:hypothetical protein